jgi:hypothetical protein
LLQRFPNSCTRNYLEKDRCQWQDKEYKNEQKREKKEPIPFHIMVTVLAARFLFLLA